MSPKLNYDFYTLRRSALFSRTAMDKLHSTESKRSRSEAMRNGESLDEINLSDLISVKSSDTKRCRYTGCENLIPIDSQFPFCDTCRTLAARNAVALVLDPISPRPLERAAEVTDTLLTSMTGEEIIAFNNRLESLYIEVCKAIKHHGLKQDSRKARTVEDAIAEARQIEAATSIRAKQAKTREDKDKRRTKKLADLLGVDEKKAKEIMGEKFDL